MTDVLPACLFTTFIFLLQFCTEETQSFMLPTGNATDLVNRILGPTKLYGLLDVLSKVQPGLYHATAPSVYVQKSAPLPYSGPPPSQYIVGPNFSPSSPAVFVPVPSVTYIQPKKQYPDVGKYAVGPAFLPKYQTTPTPLTVVGGGYGSGHRFNTPYRPTTEPYPSYPGSRYSKVVIGHGGDGNRFKQKNGDGVGNGGDYGGNGGGDYSNGNNYNGGNGGGDSGNGVSYNGGGGGGGYGGSAYSGGTPTDSNYGGGDGYGGGNSGDYSGNTGDYSYVTTPNPYNPLNAYQPQPGPLIGFNPGPGVSIGSNNNQYYGGATNSGYASQPAVTYGNGGTTNGGYVSPPVVVNYGTGGIDYSGINTGSNYNPVTDPGTTGTNTVGAPAVSVSVSPVFVVPVYPAPAAPAVDPSSGSYNYPQGCDNVLPTLASYQPPVRPIPLGGSGSIGGRPHRYHGGSGNGGGGLYVTGYQNQYNPVPTIPYPPGIPSPPSFYNYQQINGGYQGNGLSYQGGGTYPLVTDGTSGIGGSSYHPISNGYMGDTSSYNGYNGVDNGQFNGGTDFDGGGGGGNTVTNFPSFDPPNVVNQPDNVPFDQSGALDIDRKFDPGRLRGQLDAFGSRLGGGLNPGLFGTGAGIGGGGFRGVPSGSSGLNQPFLFTAGQSGLPVPGEAPLGGPDTITELGPISVSDAILALALNNILQRKSGPFSRADLDARTSNTTNGSRSA